MEENNATCNHKVGIPLFNEGGVSTTQCDKKAGGVKSELRFFFLFRKALFASHLPYALSLNGGIPTLRSTSCVIFFHPWYCRPGETLKQASEIPEPAEKTT